MPCAGETRTVGRHVMLGRMTEISLLDARVRWSDASYGHLAHRPFGEHDDSCCGPEARARRQNFHEADWLYLVQVHGNDVVVVEDPLSAAGAEADAAVTAKPNVALGIATADCAPIALASAEGIVGAVHAGWKGMQAGAVQQAVQKMRELGATEIRGALGPCIHAECYEFSGPELDDLAAQLGPDIIGSTSEGTRSLDMVAAARAVCDDAGVVLEYVHNDCTACNTNYFSYRARKDSGRQVMIVWQPAETAKAK
jgi:YfiH family protein